MNVIKLFALTAFVFLLAQVELSAQDVKVEVVNFHSTNRCYTCNAIEANAKKTVETYYKDNKKVSFAAYNVDEAKNKNIAEKFQAYGSSLFLRINNGANTEIINLTQFAFMNGRNEAKFMAELRSKINNHL
jgi:thiol-disulfide isomerase/thioredoxin